MPPKEEILKEIFTVLGDAGYEALYSVIDTEVEAAIAYERTREVKRATRALYEAKVKDEVIIQLLHDYWNIGKNQAIEALRVEKTVNMPTMVLITYLQSQGYKTSDIKEFMKYNNVKEQLENDPSLWMLSNSPAKLIKAVEGNK